MKYKEFLENLQEDERMARADYKVGPSGRKSHKEIVFKDGGAEREDDKEVKEEVELEEGYDKSSDHHKAARSMARQHGGKATFNADGSAHVSFHDTVTGRSTINPKGTLLSSASENASRAAKDHGKGKVDGNTVHFKEAKDTVVKDASGKVISFKHEGDWKKTDPKKNPEGKVHNLAGQALKQAKNLNKEEVELEENAPVAPSIGVHRISVTVSEPDHPAVSQRKETKQKFVRVTAHDKDKAIEQGKKHFAKKGFKVHGAEHVGMIHEETISESDHDPFYDAQENKKSAEAAKKQGDHFAYHLHMADHHENMAHWSSNRGRHHVANQHQAKADQHHDWAMEHKNKMKNEEVEQIDEKSEQARRNKTMKNSMDASRGARWKVQNKVSADDVRDWDGKHKTAQAQNKAIGRALRNEDAEPTISYKEFLAKLEEQLLEYTPGPGGVTRHVGTYGTAKGAKYGNTDYDNEHMDKDDDEKKSQPAVKRGRGRPAGSKSGANQKVTTGKSYGGISTHSLHLPNTNK